MLLFHNGIPLFFIHWLNLWNSMIEFFCRAENFTTNNMKGKTLKAEAYFPYTYDNFNGGNGKIKSISWILGKLLDYSLNLIRHFGQRKLRNDIFPNSSFKSFYSCGMTWNLIGLTRIPLLSSHYVDIDTHVQTCV